MTATALDWRAALSTCRSPSNLRKTVRIALVVGCVLTLINQGDVIARGDATSLTVVKICAAAFAVTLAFVPRHRSAAQVAALGAAVLVATQLTAIHWFYFYIVWFTPFALAALFCEHSTADEPDHEPAAEIAPKTVERQPELAPV